MVPHKIKSVVIRPSEGSDGDQRSPITVRPDRPTITTTEVDGVTKVHETEPFTPSQAGSSAEDVDSPLRNPREPPEPPAIQFIPATPSGMTPAEEKTKMLGNFYEELEEKPARSPSVVRRALGRRRHSTHSPSPVRKTRPGFLTRTFSLSRNVRKDTTEFPDPDDYAVANDDDIDETRLHPDWRPSYFHGYDDDDGYDYGVFDPDDDDEEEDYRHRRRRPAPLKRSLSERMKRTFAIMPLQDVYDRDAGPPPDRRTLKRTSSGNLRVVKKRGSVGSSLREKRKKDNQYHQHQHHHRPSTAPDSRDSNNNSSSSNSNNGSSSRRVFWPSRSNSLRRGQSQNRNRHGDDDDDASGVAASAPSPENGKAAAAAAAADHRDRDRERGRAMPPRTSETRRWSVSQNIGTLTRRLSEKRREKRSNELRGKISGPREVRDGVGEVYQREGFREAFMRPRGLGVREDVYPGQAY
ncbi:hypothetical protein VMCG_07854 [Cytospora schulzeri]|uniref:Uncharacterized protein n=1 Tax=Cytospora schulzeri TaxID=448051 RepID=A0A423W0F4_9PEZI|nr:hypothetical protein VMCG_07854 [Valsa malicola]